MVTINPKVYEKYKERFEGLKTYIVGSDHNMVELFQKLTGVEPLILKDPTRVLGYIPDPDLLVFTGGEDVSPELYGEKNTASNNNINRDALEIFFFKLYERNPHVLKVGICRGGQFLNVMNGGGMLQHIPGRGHSPIHRVSPLEWILSKEEGTLVNSTHHQGIIRKKEGCILLLENDVDGVTESVLYFNNQFGNSVSLCFQPHPEYDHEGTTSVFMNILHNTIEFLTKRVGVVFPLVRKEEGINLKKVRI